MLERLNISDIITLNFKKKRTMKHFIFGGLISLGALAFLTACGDEVKTSEYYKQHINEAKARVTEYEKMEKMNENQQEDCSNAKFAIEMQSE